MGMDSHALALATVMERIDLWDFDIFRLEELCGRPLLYVGVALCRRWGLSDRFEISDDALLNFLIGIEFGYNAMSRSFHNSLHGNDPLLYSDHHKTAC